MFLQTFHQSIIAHHLNDSSNFESSFEVKYIPTTTTTGNVNNNNNDNPTPYITQSDREALMRFVQEFEALQAYKSTPKKISPSPKRKYKTTTIRRFDSIISGDTTTPSLNQSPLPLPVVRDHNSNYWSSNGDDFLMDFKPNSSLSSNRSNSPNFIHSNMGCKSLTCCEFDDVDLDDDAVELMDGSIQTNSVDSSFDLHPPLLPSFNITPPPKPSRNAAYELARFLRGSFHVKRAKITHLKRSVSVNENMQQNSTESSEIKTKAVKSKEIKTKILEDTTNRTNGNSICTRIFPANTSPFRRVWEQSSLRTSRSDNYALSPKRCSPSMIASDNDVFLGTTAGKDEATKRQHLRTYSEKVTKSPRTTSWGISFEHLLEDAAGLATFAAFLKMEFSAENIYFWTSCERYRTCDGLCVRQELAKQIFDKYLASCCPEPVNLDAHTRNLSEEALQNAEKDIFVRAQKQIFNLMKFDSYQRFIRSELYKNCQDAEEKNQPLPYGADSLDALLKTNFLQSASPKLKKSASNAEDRRRKILLPWHRKTRSKSRDRMDVAMEDNHELSEGGSTTVLHTLLLPSSKLSLLKTPAKSTENFDTQNLRSSLPSSLQSLNAACSLCRVKFSDDATTIVQIKSNETVGQLVERLLEKRGLRYKLYDVILKSNNKSVDLQMSSQEIAGEEVEIEQRVTFKLYLPDPKVISVKSKPKKYLHEVVRPILQKYNYDIETVDVLRRDTMEKLDLSQLITTADGQRLHVVLRKEISNESKNGADYQNDNISLNYLKSKELANEFTARNAKSNIAKNNSVGSTETNLDEITNNIFQDIIKKKTQPKSISQLTDQYSLKSDEGGSEISAFYDVSSNKKSITNSTSNLRLRGKNSTSSSLHSADGNIITNELLNRPIIAKLKAGVKLQVTERVAEKQDELLISLKSRLDNPSTAVMHFNDLPEHIRNKENQCETALALRQMRSNLSPVSKINQQQTSIHLNTESPPPPPPHSMIRKPTTSKDNSPLANDDDEPLNHSESDETSAASKGPPPLPPKPKVLPTKPSNWGANNSD